MLMDANQWAEMLPGIIGSSSTLDVISSGMGGTINGALQLMHAEIQVISPLVPVRQVRFLRFCKQHVEGVWAVVDVSIEAIQEGPNAHAFGHCRRLPSGCIVQDMPNGFSKNPTKVDDWTADLNPQSKVVMPRAYVIPTLRPAAIGDNFQFERLA